MKTKIFSVLMVLVMTIMAIPSFVSAAVGPLTLVLSPVASEIQMSDLLSTVGTQAEIDARVNSAITITMPTAVATLTNVGDLTGNVSIRLTGNNDSNLQLWIQHPLSGHWYNANLSGWISTGVPIPATSSTSVNVYAISSVAGTYYLTVDIAYTSNTDAVVATSDGSIKVYNDSSTLSADVILGTVLFSVDPTKIDFGQVIAGRESGNQTFWITNEGNLPITVEAVVTGALYTEHMQISYDGSTWYTIAENGESSAIATPGAMQVWVKLHNPGTEHVGTDIPGTLTFIATGN